jgi:hypothetical protein
MRGLGRVLSFPADAIRQLFSFWVVHLPLSLARETRTLTTLRADNVGVLLACLEFCANKGLHVSDPPVKEFLMRLDAARGPDGRFPGLSDCYGVIANQLTWLLGFSA